MEDIVVISCTNRQNSNTHKVSKNYEGILNEKNKNVKLLDLCVLPHSIAFSEVFGNRSDAYSRLLEEYITHTKKFIFIVPEYNGSFPGILKTFLDSVHPKEWNNKKACLVGVSTGRAGNLRGLDHLTNILHYLKMDVYYNKLPISAVDRLIDADGNFNSPEQLSVCNAQVDGFLKY